MKEAGRQHINTELDCLVLDLNLSFTRWVTFSKLLNISVFQVLSEKHIINNKTYNIELFGESIMLIHANFTE